jgi:hypothetical protein
MFKPDHHSITLPDSRVCRRSSDRVHGRTGCWALPSCRTADRSEPDSWDYSEPLGGFLTCRRLGLTTEGQFSGFSALSIAFVERHDLLCHPTSELSHTSCIRPTSVCCQCWFSNGCNGQTGFTKPRQFACCAIMGFPVHAPSPDGKNTRRLGHRLSGESERPIRGATPPSQ